MNMIYAVIILYGAMFFFAIIDEKRVAISQVNGVNPKISSSYPLIFIFLLIMMVPQLYGLFMMKNVPRYGIIAISLYFSLFFLMVIFSKYSYKLFYIYYEKKFKNYESNNNIRYLNKKNQLFKWISISKKNLSLYKYKLNKNIITEEVFYTLLNQNIDLYMNYFEGKNNHVLNKMLAYSLDKQQVYKIEELDKLIEYDSLCYHSMKEVINNFDRIIGRYTIYMKEPWTIDSSVSLIYWDINNEIKVNLHKDVTLFLNISKIRSDLIDPYIELLKNANKYSVDNLIKMIIYYAQYNTHMNIKDLT